MFNGTKGLGGCCKPPPAGPRQCPARSLCKVPENICILADILVTKRVKQLYYAHNIQTNM